MRAESAYMGNGLHAFTVHELPVEAVKKLNPELVQHKLLLGHDKIKRPTVVFERHGVWRYVAFYGFNEQAKAAAGDEAKKLFDALCQGEAEWPFGKEGDANRIET